MATQIVVYVDKGGSNTPGFTRRLEAVAQEIETLGIWVFARQRT
jgi:hypothetical protein